jgi:hypothetical protein
MKKKTSKATIQQQLDARRKDINDTFTEMIKAIDDYMLVAPLRFFDGQDSAPGEYIFGFGVRASSSSYSKFDAWIERWMGALYPETLTLQETIVAGKGGDDEYMTLCYEGQQFGFLLGYLMGCRSMGATPDEMFRKTEGFTVHQLGWMKWDAEAKSREGEGQ